MKRINASDISALDTRKVLLLDISFEAYGQAVTVSFSGDGYTLSDNCPSELNTEIEAVFTDDKADNEVKNMHCFLDCLNEGKLLTEIGKVDISLSCNDEHERCII